MRSTKVPPFFRIKYSNHAQKDASHVRYIGTRPGVEKVYVKDELAQDAAHIEYAGTRPGSIGLFGPDPQNPPVLVEAMREVGNRETSSSWRIVISLREDDARELGVSNLISWQDLTRRSIAQFTKSIRMQPEHLRWVAAHHPEQGHPHVHVLAWLAKEAPRRRGRLSAQELRDVRRGVSQEVFGPLRTRLAAERILARNTMLNAVKENVRNAERIIQRLELESQVAEPVGERLPPRFTKQELESLSEQIKILAAIMPGKGQAKLSYMTVEVKDKARAAADWILSMPQMVGALTVNEKATRELTGLYTKEAVRADEAWQKAYKDLRDRVANTIVKSAATQNKSARSKEVSIEKHNVARSTLRSVWKIIEKERLKAEAKTKLASLHAEEQAEDQRRLERERGSRER